LSRGAGESALGELLCGALVLVPGADLHRDAELVQRAPQEHTLDREAGEADIARRLQVDRVEAGGQVVRQIASGELAERLGPGPAGLARRTETTDRLAQFLHYSEADGLAADLDDQRLDPVVGASRLEPSEHVRDGRLMPGHDGRQRVW